jgi:hypothetical protein
MMLVAGWQGSALLTAAASSHLPQHALHEDLPCDTSIGIDVSAVSRADKSGVQRDGCPDAPADVLHLLPAFQHDGQAPTRATLRTQLLH